MIMKIGLPIAFIILVPSKNDNRCPWKSGLSSFIVPSSLSCSLPFVPVETFPDDYLVGKKLDILLFGFVVFYVFFLSHAASVYVWTLNLIASIPDPSILTL